MSSIEIIGCFDRVAWPDPEPPGRDYIVVNTYRGGSLTMRVDGVRLNETDLYVDRLHGWVRYQVRDRDGIARKTIWRRP